ncbi:hypothetical protein [Paenochrobactrum glaciei]|uniref:DUF945 domain-containing protein n=1 Tax=Paenochrobactrum glaciei TaxID=486407 RepID=A0ABP3RDM4_9HYPH
MADQAQSTGRKGRKALLWTTVAIIVVAGGGLTGYKYSLQNAITSQIEKRGGKAESVSADFFGNIHLKNVSLPMKNGKIVNIASFDGRPEFLFLTGKVDATGISTEFNNFKINIPHLQIEDANLNRQMLADVFGGGSDLTPAQRVERFAAKKVHLSEIQVEQSILDTTQKTVYKNLTLNDMKSGSIASIKLDNAQVDMTVAVPQDDGSINKEPMTVLIGQTEGKDIDAAFMTRFYTEKANGDDNDIKQIQGAYSTKDITFKLPEATATIEEIKSAGFSMRLPEIPFLDMIQEMAAVEKIDDLSDDERRDLFRKLITIYEIFGKGDAEFLGIKIMPKDETKPSGTIASVAMTFNKQAFDMSMKGMNIGTETDYFKLDEFSWNGFDYTSSLEAAKKLLEVPSDEMDNFPFTTLMPTMGTFRITGIDADLPNTELDDADTVDDAEMDGIEGTPDTLTTPDEDQDDAAEITAPETEETTEAEAGDTTAEDSDDDSDDVIEDAEEAEEDATPAMPTRVKFKAKNMSLALLNPVNGIPTDVQISYDDLDIPVPQEADSVSLKLHELGLDRLVISSNTHILWDEPSESLIFKDISYKGDKLGSIALSGVMGGMSRDFFSGDKALMQIAAFGLTAKEINLRIEDKGMVDSAIKIAAQENGSTQEETRQLAALTIAMLAAEFAESSPQIQDAVKMLNKFIANPNIFTLSIKAKSERGIGAFEMLAITQNPMSLLDKVNISATAE